MEGERMHTSKYRRPREAHDQSTKSIHFPAHPRQTKSHELFNWEKLKVQALAALTPSHQCVNPAGCILGVVAAQKYDLRAYAAHATAAYCCENNPHPPPGVGSFVL